MSEYVILVDGQDHEVGHEEKLRAHLTSRLHRAVSVFVFDPDGRLLLQRRSAGKYHSADLWSNTCCGHPRQGESAADAARRRLHEEMGISCPLTRVCTVSYQLDVGGGLAEHELNHVFSGVFDGPPHPSPDEVREWCWMDRTSLQQALDSRPADFTPWFRLVLGHLETAATGGAAPVLIR